MRALLTYGAVWLGVTAALAFVAISLIEGDDAVTLPPVREIELTAAADRAGCDLRSGDRPDNSIAVTGPPGKPAGAGFYEAPVADAELVGALRRGVIVIHYRGDLPDEHVRALRVVREAVPGGTIVAPNDGMRYVVAAAAWKQLLGCTRWSERTIDALRLFRGRYIGRGTGEP